MPQVFAAFHPAMGTHVRPQQGPEGRWSRLGTWFWKAELGGKAGRMKRPDLGPELGKHAQTRFKATVNWRERGDVHRSAE